MQKTLDRFNTKFWCRNVRVYIQAFVKNCSVCFCKRTSKKPKKIVSVKLKSFAANEAWYIDYTILPCGTFSYTTLPTVLVGTEHLLTPSGWAILNIVDHFSKYLWSGIYDRENGEHVLLLVTQVLRERDIVVPIRITTDNGAH